METLKTRTAMTAPLESLDDRVQESFALSAFDDEGSYFRSAPAGGDNSLAVQMGETAPVSSAANPSWTDRPGSQSFIVTWGGHRLQHPHYEPLFG